MTYNESAARNFMARGRIVEGLTQAIADDFGWEDPDDVDQARSTAETVVDALIEGLVIWPSERWDEDCHDCEQRVGDHPFDGRCPT